MTATLMGEYIGPERGGSTPSIVEVLDVPLAGDFFVALDVANVIPSQGAYPGAFANNVEGLGATWTRVAPTKEQLANLWIGTGASLPGTVTTVGLGSTGSNGRRRLMVWHFRGASAIEVPAYGAAENINSAGGTGAAGDYALGITYAYSTEGAPVSTVPVSGWDTSHVGLWSNQRQVGLSHLAIRAATPLVEVTAFREVGVGVVWAGLIIARAFPPDPVPFGAGPRLTLGTGEEGLDVTGDAYTITTRRGGTPDLPTTSLETGWLRATIDGATVRPDTHPEARSGRPIRLGLELPAPTPRRWRDIPKTITWADTPTSLTWAEAGPWPDDPSIMQLFPIATGTLERSVIQYPDKGETTTRVLLEAIDVLGIAGGTPHEDTVHAGGFAHRVAEVLDPHAIPYTVTDTSGTGPDPDPLPSDARTVLDHLRLIRDTMHATIVTARDGRIAAYADRDRPSNTDTPAFTLTDRDTPASPTVIHYTHIDPDFDTSNVLNVLDVAQAGGDTTTVVDRVSVAEWGPSAGTVTINDGRVGYHAARYMAQRAAPSVTAKRVTYKASDFRQAATPDLGMVCLVQRDGLLDDLHEVTAIEHTITATTRRGGEIRWTVSLELRPLVRSPITWAGTPASTTWATTPPAITWTRAASWRP